MVRENTKHSKRIIRHTRIRSRVIGTPAMPRLSVYKSSRFMYAQLIDDDKGVTLAEASDMKMKEGTKTERSLRIGTALAEKAKKLGITKCVFDRGGFTYAGRVKALAEGARTGGLQF